MVLIAWIIRVLLRLGIPMGPLILLTVRGRKSGQPHTTPVDLFEGNGRSYLVSTHGEERSNWVLNLRAAGEGVLTRGRDRRVIGVVELTPDAAGPVLRDVTGLRLALPVRGFILRRTLGVPAGAALNEFMSAAKIHPVFEIVSSRNLSEAN
jgi:deazaflavin-dependent oxidoreductase (nitroreductase family)